MAFEDVAVRMTPLDRGGAVLNARAFDVMGNGSADDTDAFRNLFQEAADRIVTGTPGVGISQFSVPTIVLPGGLYTVTGGIGNSTAADGTRYYSGPIRIIGSDAIIQLPDDDEVTDILTLHNSQLVEIEGVIFQNGRRHVTWAFGTASGISAAVVNADATVAKLRGCVFQNSADYPIYAASQAQGSTTRIAVPKHLEVTSKFQNCAGAVFSYTNRLDFQHNWIEFNHTNPVIFNIGEGTGRNNDYVDFTGTPPDFWIVNAASWTEEGSRFGAEGAAASRPGILHITKVTLDAETFAAVKSVLRECSCFAGTAKPIVKIDTIPQCVSIRDNLIGSGDGFLIDDDYLTDWQLGSSGTASDGRPAQAFFNKNVCTGNQMSGVVGMGVLARFKRGGALFDHESTADVTLASTSGISPTNFSAWTLSSLTRTGSFGTGPDGTASASTRLQGTAPGSMHRDFGTSGASGPHCISIWIKNTGSAPIQLAIQNTGQSITYGAVLIPAGMLGWQRFDFHAQMVNGNTYRAIFAGSGTVAIPLDCEIWGFNVNEGAVPMRAF